MEPASGAPSCWQELAAAMTGGERDDWRRQSGERGMAWPAGLKPVELASRGGAPIFFNRRALVHHVLCLQLFFFFLSPDSINASLVSLHNLQFPASAALWFAAKRSNFLPGIAQSRSMIGQLLLINGAVEIQRASLPRKMAGLRGAVSAKPGSRSFAKKEKDGRRRAFEPSLIVSGRSQFVLVSPPCQVHLSSLTIGSWEGNSVHCGGMDRSGNRHKRMQRT
ncbi:hypothetical protein QBC43DRAFT_45853 [Cladorrhinum sp. PSN259]|nr:hypothetical protein QBC43DRAFT_45853 [Cladorrhinum sp. PSN259]